MGWEQGDGTVKGVVLAPLFSYGPDYGWERILQSPSDNQSLPPKILIKRGFSVV
jgi:hypothetical protein